MIRVHKRRRLEPSSKVGLKKIHTLPHSISTSLKNLAPISFTSLIFFEPLSPFTHSTHSSLILTTLPVIMMFAFVVRTSPRHTDHHATTHLSRSPPYANPPSKRLHVVLFALPHNSPSCHAQQSRHSHFAHSHPHRSSTSCSTAHTSHSIVHPLLHCTSPTSHLPTTPPLVPPHHS